jgi:exopolysaccharide biosynthesis protein
MKKISVFICAHLWLIFFCFSISAQDFRTIRDGIEYAETTRGTKDEPVHINLLKLDLTKVRLDVVHAMDAAIGLEKTSSIAARYGALAAINAGFFRIDSSIFRGDATGVLQIDNNFLSESYSERCALEILNLTDKTIVFIEKVNASAKIQINKKSYEAGINRQRKEDDIVIFTRFFNRTTLTNPDGIEFVVRKNKVVGIFDGKGSSEIPADGFVISASGKKREEFLRLLRKRTKVSEVTSYTITMDGSSKPNMFGPAEDVIGGVPQLIKNGKIEITWEQEKSSKEFVETRHPRTAVAKLKDGKFLMVTVDGRQAGYSVGMNLNELAAFLLELGATDAMNLDGGGSTTMFLDGKIVNKPSDKEGERSVGDAILVFPRKKI